jgi:hypothetical protein
MGLVWCEGLCVVQGVCCTHRSGICPSRSKLQPLLVLWVGRPVGTLLTPAAPHQPSACDVVVVVALCAVRRPYPVVKVGPQ